MNLINFLGVGTVANTKQTNTHEVFVYVPGLFPMSEGGVQAQSEEVQKTSLNSHNERVSSNTLQGNTVLCTWKDFGSSNRITPPDVREGSKVAVYTATGGNEYYWTQHGLNAETMRLETVMFGWQANPNLDENTPFDINNFYTVNVSTHEGKVNFRTSQMNGEATIFELLFDTMKGKFMLGGKEKNFLVFDDIGHSFTYTNPEGSVFQVNKENITLYSKDSVSFNGEKSINLLTKQLNLECDSAIFKIRNQWDIKCPTTNVEGNWNQTGKLDVTGTIHATGLISSDVDVKAGNISLVGHVHGGVKSGGDTSAGPQ